MSSNLTKHQYKITQKDRETLLGQQGVLLWITGLSGSGKSTIASELEYQLIKNHKQATYVLDGDNTRRGINEDLGFSQNDREENIRRVGHISKLFVEAGYITISAFISPYEKDRKFVRDLLEDRFIEVYINAPIETCAQRDPKGLYELAQKGEIKEFTGLTAPYEIPRNPELELKTNQLSVDESVKKIINHLELKKIIQTK